MNYFCPKCQSEIEERGFPYEKVYFCLFELALTQTVFIYEEYQISSSFKTILKFLESDGLIVTTEVSRNYLIAFVNLDVLWYHEPPGIFCFLEERDHIIRCSRKSKGRIDKK